MLVGSSLRRPSAYAFRRRGNRRDWNIGEHGNRAYPDFAPAVDSVDYSAVDTLAVAAPATAEATATVEEAVPVAHETVKKVVEHADGAPKFTKIEFICKESRFEALKNAMSGLGITGMTVTHVLGCGQQKGKPEYYRGAEVEATLLPKIQLDIVVSKVPVRTVIETAKKVIVHRSYRRRKDLCIRCRKRRKGQNRRRRLRRSSGCRVSSSDKHHVQSCRRFQGACTDWDTEINMCSIMGYLKSGADLALFKKGFERTVSRGPDDSRIVDTGCGLLGFTGSQ